MGTGVCANCLKKEFKKKLCARKNCLTFTKKAKLLKKVRFFLTFFLQNDTIGIPKIMEERRIPNMTEKKVLVFEEPKMDVIRFEAEDIITTSDASITLPGVAI